MKITYYVAASLDGFIADADGGVGWLEYVGIPIEQSGCAEFFATVDALVMGRKTYDRSVDWALGPMGASRHGSAPPGTRLLLRK